MNRCNPPLAATTAHMEKNGWHRIQSPNPNALVFNVPNDIYGNPLLLVLPAHETLIDAQYRMDDAMRTLAVINATTPEKMVQIINRQSAQPTTAKAKSQRLPKKPAAAKIAAKSV